MNTVLIVEDEKMIRQGIKSMIQRSGVPVQTIIECSNGQMALEVLQSQQIDVMFTDIRMPKMDGITLVQEMQKFQRRPLTVVISGYDDFSYAVEMLRMGVKEYILKPIDREQIMSIMHKMEDELTHIKEEQDTLRQAGYQQLRFLCTSEKVSAEDEELTGRYYQDSFLQGEYEVCCCSYDGEEEEQGNSYLYLHNVGGYDLFLIGCENKEFLIRNELRNCYAGFSQPVSGISSLKKAYEQAVLGRHEAFARAIKVVDCNESYMKKQTEHPKMAEEENRRLESAVHILGTERVEEAVELIQDYGRQVQNGAMDTDEFAQRMHLMLERIAVNYENAPKVRKESILELQDIYRYQTITEYVNTLTDWMRRFHDLISEEFDDYKNKQKIQQAVSYIHENYNKDLNMAVVSNYISMNYSLFSYVFKQYTGTNFVNFLKDLRMQEAKRLLETSDMRVNEISQSVGYENEKHFMKIFKATLGVSPTEYRKSIQLKGE